MPSEPNSSLRTRLRRNRLWVATGGAWSWRRRWSASGGALHRARQRGGASREGLGEADGAFRPSDTQWASLRLAPVRQVAFRDERATDGKIAINEDTTTPVFSPYSGRVSKLIARPGDLVERGAPLFAIEASEFVQGHNDLITAVAGVEKARSRLAAGADRREAAARPAGDPRRRAQGPRAGAVRSRGGAGRPALGRDRAGGGAQPAAHPRPLGRRDRATREAATASAPRPSCRRRSAARSSSARSGSASTSTPAPTTRSSRSAISRRCG